MQDSGFESVVENARDTIDGNVANVTNVVPIEEVVPETEQTEHLNDSGKSDRTEPVEIVGDDVSGVRESVLFSGAKTEDIPSVIPTPQSPDVTSAFAGAAVAASMVSPQPTHVFSQSSQMQGVAFGTQSQVPPPVPPPSEQFLGQSGMQNSQGVQGGQSLHGDIQRMQAGFPLQNNPALTELKAKEKYFFGKPAFVLCLSLIGILAVTAGMFVGLWLDAR